MPFVLANIFQPLIDVFETVIKWLHNSVNLSWGFSIIVLTIMVRVVLLPLTIKQVKSMQSMQRLAPQIKALQAKYKDDKQRQQQEMMAFYKEHQVNPFGSCLPLVMQIPVFISLFYMLRKDLRFDICPGVQAHAHALGMPTPIACGHTPESQFLFIPDITGKATGAVLVVLIVLYIGSQLASSVLMAVSADRNQRLLMIGLPFVFTTFVIRFPAGLIVYWITTNLFTVGQQFMIRKTIGVVRPGDIAPAGAAAVVSGGKGGGGSGGDGGGDGAKAPPRQLLRAAKKDKEPEKEPASAPRGGPPPPPPRRKKKRSGRRR
jgi:YidC/Oxa1 family membrane protein insertase